MAIRILFLADTHLGFDLPYRPRVTRARRGTDFLDNYRRALTPAFEGTVDCVIHGGDLLFRSKVRQQLVFLALAPLRELADSGVPVFLVPGNHERSVIPYPLLACHPNIHIFSRPRTFVLDVRGLKLAVAGFPQVRESVRSRFSSLVEGTAWRTAESDAAILCMHQAVEGSTVGPSEFVFRQGPDIVPGRLIPPDFLAVLSGHIHRAQILLRDLSGHRLGAPVLYPGSIERTSFAEQKEAKGYLTLEISGGSNCASRLANIAFHELPTRPMFRVRIPANSNWEGLLGRQLEQLPARSIVQLEFEDSEAIPDGFSSKRVRALAPAEMITNFRFRGTGSPGRVEAPQAGIRATRSGKPQLSAEREEGTD